MDRDPPKTRRESKKDWKEKRGDKIYSGKHVRKQESILEKKLKK